ncbi:N-acetylmuramidase domain-containing protein [Aurantimonas coralicida]|uniref:N-acetylmuramidase domain-containing protein n=1 Tax=Aurantimonas coralicida TaxID=182270 RepID=UPI001E5A25E5|nr:N-acetylmuramidase domain-containing protein [Aurantimonas coralicida]MCD1644437.1 N-acetylmuramidase domain-containing protein [Aurantimonas coralicida]
MRRFSAQRHVSKTSGIDAAVLVAVALVETNAVAFARVDDRREPLIRFEGHYFDRLLSGPARQRARAAGLADPRAGRIRNPASQSARWKLFDAAAAIDAAAAAASVSWGLCQVMGSHWKALGYRDAADLAAAARASAEGQFEIAARFLAAGRLADRLVNGDVAGFARRYNGPAYRRNRYDEKIAAALRKARSLLGTDPATGELRRGTRGDRVRRLQGALVAHGHRLVVDGIFGPGTEAALTSFQASHGLPVSAAADAATMARLGVSAKPCAKAR